MVQHGLVATDLISVLAYLQEADELLREELERSRHILQKSAGKGWSISQIVEHLICTERFMMPIWIVAPKLERWPGVLRRLDSGCSWVFRVSGMRTAIAPDTPPGRDDATAGRYVAPKFLEPRRRELGLEELLAKRNGVRERTLKAIQRIGPDSLNRLTWSHPLLGTYTLLEFAEFLGMHDARHTAQIRRIREGLATRAGTSA